MITTRCARGRGGHFYRLKKVQAIAIFYIILAVLGQFAGATSALSQDATCSDDAVAETIDKIGSTLRSTEKQTRKVFRPKLEQLAKIKNMNIAQAESWLWLNLKNPAIIELDKKIDSSLGDVDRAGNIDDPSKNCETIAKLNTIETNLKGLLQQRSELALAELNTHITTAGTAATPRTPPAQTKQTATAKAKPVKAAKPAAIARAAPKPAPAAAPAPVPGTITANDLEPDWSAELQPGDVPGEATSALPRAGPQYPGADYNPPGIPYPDPAQNSEKTFTVAEISQAGTGVFGNVSSHIAAAINGAFSKFGQPNAYVTGTEGGGALLAGITYGKGTLHLADGSDHDVYWNGPSLGYDLGADGSRVMFLIYNLRAKDQLFGRYPGVAGMAYLAGGVGVTVLNRNKTTIVPIRAGVGLRLGANLSYLRFSPYRRWNPF